MIAVDTNILARYYFAADDADAATIRQSAAARKLFASGKRLFVPLTVLLEFEWIFRGVYGLPRGQFSAVARNLLGLQTVDVERADLAFRALAMHDAGMDFADALHLATAHGCTDMATFDKAFAKVAAKLKTKPAVTAPA